MKKSPQPLSELDAVHWSDLSHAYGAASDVPAHIRGLTDDHWEERSESYGALISKIWHQGDVYEATAAAVPFLVSLLCESTGPASYFAGAVLALVAKSAFSPMATVDVSDNEARRQTREQFGALEARFSTFCEQAPQQDPRSTLARSISRLVAGDSDSVSERLMEAYAGCERRADELGREDEPPASVAEFANWLDENPLPSRRGQVFALGRAREYAVEYPHLAVRALVRITADHLQHEKRVVEVLVEVGRGHQRAEEMALELGREWLAPAEAGGFNQSVSRERVLDMLEHFSGQSVQTLRRRVCEAEEPDYVIPDW